MSGPSDLHLQDKTWDDLIAQAQSGQERSQMVQVEVARRIVTSVDDFRKSADRYSERLFWLNLILVALTAVLIVVTWLLVRRA